MYFDTSRRLFKTLSIERFLNEVGKVDTSEPCILHFRFATHGSIKISNCHPFKKSGVCFSHNGVLHTVRAMQDMTDSETLFINEVMPLINEYGFDSNEVVEQLEQYAIFEYSRFALHNQKTGQIITFGRFHDYQGCKYSNTQLF
jgi:glutamine phosphoribosylpyrophosphate amidotransferase